ncbi:MAG: ferrochelatase [Bacteroidetes bacterium]|nr:ferrochelatase [Bacteroidota bacterium]
MQAKTGVLLVNLGTPDGPSTKEVRSYLFQFLNDKRVIDLPWLSRTLLVNGVIVPFRAPKSAKIYQELWTQQGSPILTHTKNLSKKLQSSLGKRYYVDYAMRYKNPSIPSVMERFRQKNLEQIIIIPLYPQHASSSSTSTMEAVMDTLKKWWVMPEISIVSQFFDDKLYLDAFAEKGKEHELSSYDHIIFSFHGLPIRQVDKAHLSGTCNEACKEQITNENRLCYNATSYETARQLAKRLGIKESDYTVSFQSRLDDKWLKPYSDKVVAERAKLGDKKLLIFSPAFVADCLETTIEIGVEYQEIFEEHGGEKVQLVESLNDNDTWVESLKQMVLNRSL